MPAELTDFLAPPQAPDEIGRLGPYRVLAVLGRGGMGVVFRAEDPGLQRLVALKAMLPGLAASGSAKERFLREARAAAAVHDDHVVTIHQVGEDRGAPFLAMEFLQGEPLDARLVRDPRLPVAEVARIGREACLGLAAAHERGLIHRDIKPANLWLERKRGRVKILDFGLARAAADTTGLTQQGAILGTPAYMAPEQARAVAVDQRADLFSLGCVLYRLAAGELPFKGSDTISILAALALDTPKPLRELNADVPPALADLVMRLLEKDPADRPESAEAVARALQAFAGEAPPAEAPSRVPSSKPGQPPELPTATMNRHSHEGAAGVPRPGGRRRWVAAGVLACLLLAGAAALLLRPKAVAVLPSSDSQEKRPPAVTPPVKAIDPDREAAEYALSVGGTVWVNGQVIDLKAAAQLPREPFRLTGGLPERRQGG